jgi:hypothetical protein
MPYDIGDSVSLAWDVKDSAGVLANATTVTLTVTLPDGTTATPAVTNPPTVDGPVPGHLRPHARGPVRVARGHALARTPPTRTCSWSGAPSRRLSCRWLTRSAPEHHHR